MYEADFFGWAIETADKIRSGDRDLDWESIAEELEGLGRATQVKLESLLTVILLHFLKWQFQPVYRGRSWSLTIAEHRRQVVRHLSRNLSLKPLIPETIADAYDTARYRAAVATGFELDTFPSECPYSWAEISAENWLPS
jgi:hypothetical protein